MHSILLSSFLALTNVQMLPFQDAYALPILAGISNHGEDKHQPYVTAGDRTYLSGTQDGKFPHPGENVPREMGGLSLPPSQLPDRFCATVTAAASNQAIDL